MTEYKYGGSGAGGSASWKDAVNTYSDLPVGSSVGETRLVIDTEELYTWDGSAWVLMTSTSSVSGPASSTDNAIARYDSTTGRIIQDSLVTIDDSGNVIIPGNLRVNGTETIVNTETLEVKDPNITVNSGGDDTTAEGAGLTVERTGTNGSLIYENALTSKFKLGALGSEVEVADISSTQTLTNKVIDVDSNTVSNIEVDNLKAGVLDTDIETTSASDDTIPSALAVNTQFLRLGERTKEPTGFPNRTDSTISISTDQFTIEPSSTSFDYYIHGVKYTKSSADTITIPDTEGLHYVYYNGSTLISSTTMSKTVLTDYAIVAVIYWNATDNVALYMGDERHSTVMDGATHYYLHDTVGTVFHEGLALSNFSIDGTGSSDLDAQFDSSEGTIFDEDLSHTVDATTAGSSDIPIFYKSGVNGYWKLDAPTGFVAKRYGTSRLAYNQYTGGTWQQTEVDDLRYVLTHLYATNDTTYKLIAVQGQSTYINIITARQGAIEEINNINLSGMAFAEFTPIASIIFQTADAYTNTIKARIRSTDTGDNYVDFRGASLSPSINAVDHGNLAGLLDDDHPQYALLTGRTGDALSIDNVTEFTSDAGVTIESSLLKDGEITTGQGLELEKMTSIGLSTALISGGEVTINVDTTKFDVSAGSGIVIDAHTDPENPVYTEVSWSAFTAQTVTNLATSAATFLGIDSTGSIVQTTSDFTNEQRRDYIQIGSLQHPNLTSISGIVQSSNPVLNTAAALKDFSRAIGAVIEGAQFSANGANVKIDRSAATSFFYGSNFRNSVKNPHELTTSAETAVTFVHVYRNGSGGFTVTTPTTDLDIAHYDNGTGTLAAVPASDPYQIFRFFYVASSNLVVVHYGQAIYKSLSVAVGSIQSEEFDKAALLTNSPLRTWLVVERTVTDIASAVTAGTARFIAAGKFGDSTTSSASTSTTDLQTAYNNSSEPEIVLTSTRGALSIQDADTPIGANLFEVSDYGKTTDYLAVSSSGITLSSGVTVNSILDDDTLSADSATALATQQSIKAYVDNHSAGIDIESKSASFNAADGITYLVDTTSTAIAVQLPTPALNISITIKDSGFNANANNITLVRAASENIEGVAATYTIDSSGASVVIVSDGTDWFLL